MFSVAIALGHDDALRHYAPLTISPALRGYASVSQVQLPAGALPKKFVSITELAIRFCPTGRDLYLAKFGGYQASWYRDVLGRVVDRILVDLHQAGLEIIEDAFENALSPRAIDLSAIEAQIKDAGRTIVGRALNDWRFESKHPKYEGMDFEQFAEAMRPGNGTSLIEGTTSSLFKLVELETEDLCTYIHRCRGSVLKQLALRAATCLRRGLETIHRAGLKPEAWKLAWLDAKSQAPLDESWMARTRATLMRLQTGVQLDSKRFPARTFGVTDNICPDFLYAVAIVGDMKTGPNPEMYASVATGYALFAEYVLKRRVNTAAIMAVDIDIEAGTVLSRRVLPVRPDDALRNLWVTKRDFALRIYAQGSEPSHPENTAACQACVFRSECWVAGNIGGQPIVDGKPA